MGWEVEFIKLLQSGGNKFGDYLFYVLTGLGTEIFFMLVVMLVFWCIDKREGFRLVCLFTASQIVVGTLKVLVKRPRPYTVDGVKAIMQRTDGYSFPSGHSNNIAVVSTHATIMGGKRYNAFWYTLIVSCLITVLVMLSRMYLGQHYLTDVLAGAAIGVGVGCLGYFIFDKVKDEEKFAYVTIPLCVVLFVAAIVIFAVKGDALDTLMQIAGTLSAASIGYFIEKRHVGYNVVSERKRNYVYRFLLGAAVVALLNFGLKAALKLFATGITELILIDFALYFFIGIWVTLLAPMTFKKLKI